MTDLATRCEQAEGPDRSLDTEIARSLGWGCVMQDPQAGLRWYCWKEFYRSGDWISLPNYTASLDAALTLVPEGWRLRQMAFSAPCADDRKWHLNLHGGKVGEETFVGRGSSPALALCAAALRAHAKGHNDD
jgi:hypothetical protein